MDNQKRCWSCGSRDSLCYVLPTNGRVETKSSKDELQVWGERTDTSYIFFREACG